MARDLESQSCLYYKYLYFFLLWKSWEVEGRQIVRTEGLPILLPPARPSQLQVHPLPHTESNRRHEVPLHFFLLLLS